MPILRTIRPDNGTLPTLSTDDCWLWAGNLYGNGHGQIYLGRENGHGKTVSAHRVVYENEIGEIPEGLDIDHLCNNPPCINPAHLEPVTHGENTRRARRRKTHCKRGHEFTKDNIYWFGDGTRICRECALLRKRGPVSETKPPRSKS